MSPLYTLPNYQVELIIPTKTAQTLLYIKLYATTIKQGYVSIQTNILYNILGSSCITYMTEEGEKLFI